MVVLVVVVGGPFGSPSPPLFCIFSFCLTEVHWVAPSYFILPLQALNFHPVSLTQLSAFSFWWSQFSAVPSVLLQRLFAHFPECCKTIGDVLNNGALQKSPPHHCFHRQLGQRFMAWEKAVAHADWKIIHIINSQLNTKCCILKKWMQYFILQGFLLPFKTCLSL